MTNRLAAALADRKTGIGCDQLILLESSALADVRMRIFNADGSESGACGNAMRAEFWVRSASLLAALGSLMLALVFGTESVRGLIIASLFGSFSAVAFVTRAIWKTIPQENAAYAGELL